MKPIRLLELLRHVEQKTICPECKARIPAHSIKIEGSTDNSAFLAIRCPKCNRDLHAHVLLNFVEMPKNTSEEKVPEDGFLNDFHGSVSDLFSEEK